MDAGEAGETGEAHEAVEAAGPRRANRARGLPNATYRVQLHRDFDFAAAASIVPFVAALGVSHLYCSPYLQAAPGSSHGYDVADPTRLSDELGGAAGFAGLVSSLQEAGLGQVLDIVPNHMVADPAANRWWWDVLENGPSSPFGAVFDIDWDGEDPQNASTVLVPVLGDHFGRVLEAGQLEAFREGSSFRLRYRDHTLPLSLRSLDALLAAAARRAGSSELGRIAEELAALPPDRPRCPEVSEERAEHGEDLVSNLAVLAQLEPAVAAAIDAELAELNGDPDRLDDVLRRQHYRLAHWRAANDELDYRRFFNIESLAGVRVEDPAVFEMTHRLILQLVSEGLVDGLRVDHVDGLRDPAGYLDRLDQATAGCYTIVEKILEGDEALPPWPVDGTSGYDFAFRVNNLFVVTAAENAMTEIYEGFTGEKGSYADVVHEAKLQVMREELGAEVGRLTSLLARICDDHRRHRDHTRRELRKALCELVAHFPVYRTYVRAGQPRRPEDVRVMARAVEATRRCRPDIDAELIGFLGEVALAEHPGYLEADFSARLQQLTAPVMAKGVEDTAFYRYHRLVSLNEVGGNPAVFGRPVADFHRDLSAAAERWPASMLTLSTHDTKRSADVRARLNVLSELPQAWGEAVEQWAESNDAYRSGGWPDRNVEYLLYQTLVGAWPLGADRAAAFMAKAAKEAKVHTTWADPDPAYDEAVERFVRGVLGDEGFVARLEGFLTSTDLVVRGRRNSLAQTALLLTCPGVPDLYQGSELWDLSLVDPDNRRPVDFGLRRRLLEAPSVRGETALDGAAALHGDSQGISKLALVQRLLADRRRHPERYAGDDYDPIPIDGTGGSEVVAFARRGLVVAVACRSSLGPGELAVELPPGTWRDLLTGEPVHGSPDLAAALRSFPVAVFGSD